MAAAHFIKSLLHPTEISALIQYKFLRSSNISKEIPFWSEKKIRCYQFLEKTSGSFALIIMELEREYRDLVCMFYLVLRGMDTIEDDMTMPIDKKIPLLRTFHEKVSQKGWTFTENGQNEKDRQLLVEFDVVIDEFLLLTKECQNIIIDITKEMGNGMADYIEKTAYNKYNILTIKEFDDYCYYVAGLVGIGLNDLFIATGAKVPYTSKNYKTITSMGIFLQKINILRDLTEDLMEKRRYWPKQIWSKYVEEIEELILPKNKMVSIYCLSEMIFNTLLHVIDCLNYLIKVNGEDMLIFGFAAKPLIVAYATLALAFKNHAVFAVENSIKIRKGEIAKLVIQCTDMHEVARLFEEYTIVIMKKNNDPLDPNFTNINIVGDQILQWCKTNIPNKPNNKNSFNNKSTFIIIGFLIVFISLYFNRKTNLDMWG
ncbi:4235_t:CDS:2 [Funneliformis geosporum]|uniref:Squalene synthase n=1 Tax=Funneliformis geosporum TaxID=1117311 RepID=A0A9W4SV15_9GLOM|nr:4235_t:CDS:2 [Funneliformis geosporum]CAI2184308.1 5743_t:CDS:2 [Funneliformis geosporum]